MIIQCYWNIKMIQFYSLISDKKQAFLFLDETIQTNFQRMSSLLLIISQLLELMNNKNRTTMKVFSRHVRY
jgi:hypothetical protein